jgi:hypothetical protein
MSWAYLKKMEFKPWLPTEAASFDSWDDNTLLVVRRGGIIGGLPLKGAWCSGESGCELRSHPKFPSCAPDNSRSKLKEPGSNAPALFVIL